MATTNTPPTEKPKHTNRLISVKSPYLLKHVHSPIQWYPWCQEAIDKAKKENKPIFLSIGFSTCQRCYVKETESIECEEVVKIMNEHFINIKLDHEERPDIHQVYNLYQNILGCDEWPMSIFLTPNLHPFKSITCFCPEDLLLIADQWKNNPETFLKDSESNMIVMQFVTEVEPPLDLDNISFLQIKTWKKLFFKYVNKFIPEFGGFTYEPRFPQVPILNFLFHYYARNINSHDGNACLYMCTITLASIARGGIHDHISGGFARYSVNEQWQLPHFKKTLYDQAQLITAYTDAFLATKIEFFAEVVRDIIKYVNRDLRHESGGFYSSEEADSYPEFGAANKKEGAFYTWEYKELKSLLEYKKINAVSYLDVFCDYFNVEKNGNISPRYDSHGDFTNQNVLIIFHEKEDTALKYELSIELFNQVISECVQILYDARQKRPRPDLDTKMLSSWNGLMIAGLAQAGQGLGEKQFVEDAIKVAEFIQKYLYVESKKILLHSCYKAEDGSIVQAPEPIKAFLKDYAFLIKGLLDLYEASLDCRWLKWARDLQQKQNELFWDNIAGGYYPCSTEDASVLVRTKLGNDDDAEPGGNSVACHNLQRLAAYADESAAADDGDRNREMALQLLSAFSRELDNDPMYFPEMMSALMFYYDSPTQVLITGGCSDPRTLELARVVRSRLLPARVLAVADPASESPVSISNILLSRIRSFGDVPAAYVCRHNACSLPITDPTRLENLLDESPAVLPSNL